MPKRRKHIEMDRLMIQYFSPMEVSVDLPDRLVAGKPLVGLPTYRWKHNNRSLDKQLNWFEKLTTTIIKGYLSNMKNGLKKPKEFSTALQTYYCEIGLTSVEEILEGTGFDFWCELAGLNPEVCVKLFEKALGMSLETVRAKLRKYVEEVKNGKQMVSVRKSSENSRP